MLRICELLLTASGEEAAWSQACVLQIKGGVAAGTQCSIQRLQKILACIH